MENAPEISSIWGIIIPGAVFIVSFTMTWLLYRHFANQGKE